jgi:hypothetical protein
MDPEAPAQVTFLLWSAYGRWHVAETTPKNPTPTTIIPTATSWPCPVTGKVSPYPTIDIVTKAHQNLRVRQRCAGETAQDRFTSDTFTLRGRFRVVKHIS